MENGKLLRVTMEFENVIQTIEGEVAEQWLKNGDANCGLLAIRGMNAYDLNPITWETKPKLT